MNNLSIWIHTPFAQALGWTLLHFVWEGAVLAMVLGIGLWLLGPARARHRYAVACMVLAAMVLGFGATLAVMWSRQPSAVIVSVSTPVRVPSATVFPLPAPTAAAPPISIALLLSRLAWLGPVWMFGVLCFYIRAMAGWLTVQRLRRRGVCAPPPEWQLLLDRLCRRLQLSRPVALLESCLTDTPVLIGYWRPIVLLPLGCLTGLSTAQVECILLHELAHVLRHDYAVNLLQSLVEGLLFYHPAVWWASRVARAERENCCDDVVVEMMGDARSYAATLAALETCRATMPEAAMAATGGNLMKRIRRLTVEPQAGQTSAAPGISAALLLVLFAAGLMALPPKPQSSSRRQTARASSGMLLQVTPAPQRKAATSEPQDRLTGPYQKWVREDVAYIITNEERAAFERLLGDAEREQFIENFWKKRDPRPGTVENEFKKEHYRRIAYTNEQFSDTVPGWKTDRGRIYITYGPPDSSSEQNGGRRQEWVYKFIEGVGNNIKVAFEDQDGSGKLRLTDDSVKLHAVSGSAGHAAGVFVSPDSQVSVVVAGPAPNGTIGVADVLKVSYIADSGKATLQAEIAAKKTQLQAMLQRYTPNFPEVRALQNQLSLLEQQQNVRTSQSQAVAAEQSMMSRKQEQDLQAQLQGLRMELESKTRQLAHSNAELVAAAQEKLADAPKVAQQYNLLMADLTLARSLYQKAGEKNPDSQETKAARAGLVAAESALAEFSSKNQGRLPEDRGSNLVNVQARSAELSSLNNQISDIKQQMTSYEAALDRLHSGQSQGGPQAAAERVESRVTVRPDGKISLGYGQEVTAAGLTAAQLEGELGRQLGQRDVTVRIEKAAFASSSSVIFLVPVDKAKAKFHVYGKVTAAGNQNVASFEDDVSGGAPPYASAFSLRPGKYHVSVVTKNLANGATRNSALDFTVD